MVLLRKLKLTPQAEGKYLQNIYLIKNLHPELKTQTLQLNKKTWLGGIK